MSNFFKAIIGLVFGKQCKNKAIKAIAESVKSERDAYLDSVLSKKVEQIISRTPTESEMNQNYSVEHEGIRRHHKWSGVTLLTVVSAEDL